MDTPTSQADAGSPRLLRAEAGRFWRPWGWQAARLWGRMPFAWRLAVARRLGDWFLRLESVERDYLLTNLSLCFADLTATQRDELARLNTVETVLAAMNQYRCWALSLSQIRRDVCLENVATLHEASQRGPVVVVCPHFLGAEFAIFRLGIEFASMRPGLAGMMNVVYDPSREPDFEAWRQAMRLRLGPCQFTAAGNSLRPLLRGLQNRTPVVLLPDLDMGPQGSVFVPFFGVEAATVRTAAWCAAKTGASIIPVSIRRTAGDHFVATVQPPVQQLGSDINDGTRRISAAIETMVREAPHLYWWAQARFATRPGGEPAFYGAAATAVANMRFVDAPDTT
jgi:Kdo2-lipid IVA lauroyltransferase/acyltransferase